MNRLSLSLIFLFVAGCCVYSPAKVMATTNSEKKSNNSSINKANKTNNSSGLVLVPPPPPGEPSILDWSGMPNMPVSIDFLNYDELKTRLEHIRKRIKDTETQVEENNQQVSKCKDDAENFNSLYAEGVISRKELESTQKKISEAERIAEQSKDNLADLKLQENAIIRQLKIKKAKKR